MTAKTLDATFFRSEAPLNPSPERMTNRCSVWRCINCEERANHMSAECIRVRWSEVRWSTYMRFRVHIRTYTSVERLCAPTGTHMNKNPGTENRPLMA